jgi:hypothetical protein
MTDEDARRAQDAIRSIRAAPSERWLSDIEAAAAKGGYLQHVKPELERRRLQLGRRARR